MLVSCVLLNIFVVKVLLMLVFGSLGKKCHIVSYRHVNFCVDLGSSGSIWMYFIIHLRVCVNMREESSRWYGKYGVVVSLRSILVIGERASGSI